MPLHEVLGSIFGKVVGGVLADPIASAQAYRIFREGGARSQPPIVYAGPGVSGAVPQPQAQTFNFAAAGGGPIMAQQAGLFDFPELRSPFGADCPTLFRPTRSRMRPARVVVIPHPETGEPTFFGHLGRPLLFSRDLSAVRRVNKLAARARRTTRKR